MKLCPGQFESNTQKYIFVESVHTKLSAVQLSLMARLSYPALPGVLRDFQVLYKILIILESYSENS